MWNGIGDQVTDLIFRVEQFDPEFLYYLGSRWQLDRAQTIHQQADRSSRPSRRPPGASAQQQDAAIAASQQSTEKKREPVRNVGKKVGRNDPCPCGSGKKFKACCMRKQSTADPSERPDRRLADRPSRAGASAPDGAGTRSAEFASRVITRSMT